MGRRKRNLSQPCCYHVTHRCQERRFLFRFEIDRHNYVERLRQMTQRFPVDVLNYIVTSNHVHLLLYAKQTPDISAGLHFLQGNTARDYNRRVKREGAFWRGRYHPTLIEDGYHLGRCLFYIDLNMVRAGVVSHPGQWRTSGYHELSGKRQRYRLVNVRQLIACIGHDAEIPGSVEHFREWYEKTLTGKLANEEYTRQAYWTEASAIGSEAFVKRFTSLPLTGQVNAISEEPVREDQRLYTLTLSKRDQRTLWQRQQRDS